MTPLLHDTYGFPGQLCHVTLKVMSWHSGPEGTFQTSLRNRQSVIHGEENWRILSLSPLAWIYIWMNCSHSYKHCNCICIKHKLLWKGGWKQLHLTLPCNPRVCIFQMDNWRLKAMNLRRRAVSLTSDQARVSIRSHAYLTQSLNSGNFKAEDLEDV